MTWPTAVATATELGHTFPVAGPAFVAQFYGDAGTNTAAAGVFDAWLGLARPEADLYCLHKTARRYQKLGAAALARVRAALREPGPDGQFYAIKDAAGFAIGTVAFEVKAGVPEGGPYANRIVAAFPPDLPDRLGAAAVRDWFRGVIAAAPFTHATAGYGYDLVWGREWEMAGMPVSMAAARRHLAVDVRDRLLEDTLARTMKGPGWLTFVRDDLLEAAGGSDALDRELTAAVGREQVSGGILLTAGDAPPVGDVNRRAADLGPLRAVARALKPLRAAEWRSVNLFGIDEADADAWFGRLDE